MALVFVFEGIWAPKDRLNGIQNQNNKNIEQQLKRNSALLERITLLEAKLLVGVRF
jgi:hypothetical protein